MGVSEAVEGEDEVLLEDWPLRPWLLAAIGAVAGIAVWALVDGGENVPWRLGIASFAFFAAAASGFALRRRGWLETAVFSLGLGVVMGGIAFMAARASDTRAGQDFAFAAGVFFSVLAIPLFQAGFHRTRFATPYRETHFHVWTDAVSAGGAFAFALLSWALVWLLHGLFSLIGIKAIGDLLGEGWFSAAYLGASFGAGLGVIRNNLRILGALQGVVLLVLSLLALPFAAAILVFLVLLLASGGQALWNATSDSTPVLLACAVGCFILANSVIRDGDDARSGNRLMQGAAAVLAACILPLSLFAAISMGIRIDQYGLAPERIWALVAIAVAVAYGVAYWAGLLRGRMVGWSEHLRRANLHLAAVVCVLALLLSLPIVDFGAISAGNQVARLKRGDVSAEEFDYAALRWDFGDAGRRALARLAASDTQFAVRAAETEQMKDRWARYDPLGAETEHPKFAERLVIYPRGSTMPDGLLDAIKGSSACMRDVVCRVYLQEDQASAAVLGDECATRFEDEEDWVSPEKACTVWPEAFVLENGRWRDAEDRPSEPSMSRQEKIEGARRERQAIQEGRVTIRPSSKRALFIGDEQFGNDFE